MIIRALFITAALFLAGCASSPMNVAQQQTLVQPNSQQAQIIFMRSSFVGSAISASVYDVTDGKTEFIGILDNGTKLAHSAAPGKRTFMVVSEAADYMEAEVEAGKSYYSIVTPRMGFWKARFSMWPIKQDPTAEFQLDSKDFNSWVTGTKLVENSPKSLAWFEQNKSSIEKKHQEYWPVWLNKSPEDLAQRTLTPADGR